MLKNSFQNKSFAERVYATIACIPRGMVSTYGAVAEAMGAPRAARAVGTALKRNPHAPVVPCHRIVRSDRLLGAYAGGARKKRALLVAEGVLLHGDRVDGACIVHAKTLQLLCKA